LRALFPALLTLTALLLPAGAAAESCLGTGSAETAGAPVLARLRCNGRAAPEGIDQPPKFSWEIATDNAAGGTAGAPRDVRQTAFRVLVASSPEKLAANNGDIWDSGVTTGDASNNVPFGGGATGSAGSGEKLKLASRARCFWKAKVWTNVGETPWSAPQKFSVGLLDAADWSAKWTGLESVAAGERLKGKTRLAARYFRKEFTAEKQPVRATVFVSAAGLYQLRINGKHIGDDAFAPAPTEFPKSLKYNTFDVTGSVKQGANAIGVTVGNGLYLRVRDWIRNFGQPRFILQLELEFADGSRQTIVSDETWRVTAGGPIRANNIYDGEEYDARKEFPGWDRAGFVEKAEHQWRAAEVVKAPGGKLSAQFNPNVKITETLPVKTITKIKDGVFVLDIGQNIAGWLRLQNVNGASGQKIKLRFAERINKDGTLYTANLRTAECTDSYTLNGSGNESWEPRFVYHGFRYAEVSGWPDDAPKKENFTAVFVHDEVENTGDFHCSNDTLNRIYNNARRSIRGSYQGVPVDCPQRDERWGWLGDRSAGCHGESFIFNNALLYTKWLDDIADTQNKAGALMDVAPNFYSGHATSDNMTWPGTFVFAANMLLDQFGDDAPARRHYDAMKKWLAYMRGKYLRDGIMTRDKYGDWCQPPQFIKNNKPSGALIATSHYYKMICIMRKFAERFGKNADAQAFAAEAEKVKTAFNQKFHNAQKHHYENNSVTGNVLALAFGLAPETDAPKIAQSIVERTEKEFGGHISTGLIGTQWLMRALSENGAGELALKLATNRTAPSWGYMVEKGATTIWELWNGDTAGPAMNSHNHCMLLGDLVIWFYEYLAGIRNDPAGGGGFKKIILKPLFPAGLEHVRASHRSPYGLIKSEWRRSDPARSPAGSAKITWHITIPPNSTATAFVPTTGSATGAKPITLGSGDYVFTW
jgi:alpha-L-rhamnosidase